MEAFMHLYPCLMKQGSINMNRCAGSFKELSRTINSLNEPFLKLMELSKKIQERIFINEYNTGYYHVSMIKDKNIGQGFYYRYVYVEDNKIKTLFSSDLRELKLKVKKRSLKWEIIDNKLAIKTKTQNILYNFDNEIKWDEID